jgi:uncharacterized Zn-finger protein
MKTRIQDLDDKVFQDLISDQLCKGDLYKDTDVTHTTLTSINHYSPESKSNSKYSNQDIGPPALVKEPLVFDGEVKPKEMKQKCLSKDNIKKSCRCRNCESSPKQERIIRRENMQHIDAEDENVDVDANSSTCSYDSKSADAFKSPVTLDQLDNKSFKCDICSNIFQTCDLLTQHRKLHKTFSGNLTYECDECGQRFWSEHYLKVHYSTQHVKSDGINSCHICGAGFRWQANLTEHIKTHNKDNCFKCDACGEQFSQKLFLTDHMKTHVEHRLHECHECEARFLTESKLHDHLRSHKSENLYKCVICGQRFFFENTLEEHVLTHIGIYPYKCDECGAGFNHESHLKEHASVHLVGKVFTCNVCSKLFSTESALDKHVISHSVVNICHICKEVLLDKNSFKAHLKIHKERKYSCKICGEHFRCKYSLTKHEKQHLYEKRSNNDINGQSADDELLRKDETFVFDCDLCYDRFQSIQDLQTHFLTHADRDKPSKSKRKKLSYDCAICHKKFRKSKHLKMHILTHSSTLNCTCRCQICGKGFTHLANLEKHIENHHITKYQCDICDQKFEFDKELENHILTHFEKNKTLAIDVSQEVNKRMKETSSRGPQKDIQCGIVTSVESKKCLDSEQDSTLYNDIKKNIFEPDHLKKLRDIAKKVYSSKQRTLAKSAQPILEDTSSVHDQNSSNVCSEVDSVSSPRETEHIPFSPSGKCIGSDTDSGYSEKLNILTSDTDSISSTHCIYSEISHKGFHCTTISPSTVNFERKYYENSLASVDSRKTDIINDHISDTSENSDASNLTQVHNRTPSINDTVSSNIKMNMPMLSSVNSGSHVPNTRQENAIPSMKRSLETLHYDDNQSLPHKTPRVPFYFNFRGKKPHHINHVNFHLLGKLK